MASERFDWLEFSPEAPAAAPAAEGGRGVADIMAEAARAFAEGDYEPALRLYSEALKHDRARHEAWAGQVRCLVRLGEFREAQTWAAKACGLFPGQPVLESARALALAASGLVSEARAASDRALEMAEKAGVEDPDLWLERGTCLLADGQKATAGHCFGKALEIAGNDPDWEQRVALEMLEGGQLPEALERLNALVARKASRPYAWVLLARAARRLGMRQRALEALDQAERLRPNYPPAAEERRLLRRSCWIATAVFGSERHPAVAALRRWRDEAWLPRPAGRAAAACYDRTAPALCRALFRWPAARRALRRPLAALAARVAPTPAGSIPIAPEEDR